MQRTAVLADDPLSEEWLEDDLAADDDDDDALYVPTNIQSFTRAEGNAGYLHRRPTAQAVPTQADGNLSSASSGSSPDSASQTQPASASTQSASAANSASNSTDDRMCRICLDDEDQTGLISPCKCKGTSRFVHKRCLEQWRQTSVGSKSFYQCDQCHYQYDFRTRGGLATLLSSKWTLHIITLLLFLLSALIGGYVAKALDVLTGGNFHHTIQELSFEAQYASLDSTYQQEQILREYYAHPEHFIQPMSWSDFLHIDITHMLFGVVSMGVTGFLSLLISISAGGSFFFNAFRLNSFRNSEQKGGIECVVLVVIVVIGLVRCVQGLYKFVERRADYVLKNATSMVENVT